MSIAGSGGVFNRGRNNTPRAPIEEDTSLRSRDYIRVLTVVSEGEIEGFPTDDARESIFVDRTPVIAPDGTLNFSSLNSEFRQGTPIQSPMPGFDSIEEFEEVNLEVLNGQSVTRTITNPNTDDIRVILSTNQFQKIEDNGDVVSTKVVLEFQISTNGGPFVKVYEDTWEGKTSGPYRRSYLFQDSVAGNGPWSIRIIRRTDNAPDSQTQNSIFWTSISSVQWVQNTYDNTAVYGFHASAEDLTSNPELSFDLQGIKIKVPHNYTPAQGLYEGVFNGSLQTLYSNNPAWVLYDLLTNERYGLAIPEDRIDVFSFYSAGIYCDGSVTDGAQGNERRYRFNSYIQNKGSAYEIISAVLSSFNAQLYLENGSVTLVVDRPKDVVALFSDSNVVHEYGEDGTLTSPPFQYETTAENSRYNSVLVTWFDPNEFHEAKTLRVQDSGDIASNGYNPTEITAMGCTSRGQAIRAGRWLLYSNLFLTKTVTFAIGKDGVSLAPGDVVKIQDRNVTPQRLAGRVVGFTLSPPTVTLDSPINIDATKEYELEWLATNGTIQRRGFVEVDGDLTTVNLSGADLQSGQAPDIGGYWVMNILEEEEGTLWSVRSISEEPDSESTRFTVNAVQYDPDKWEFIDNFSQEDSDLNISSNFPLPEGPRNILFNETLYAVTRTSGIETKLDVTWQAPPNVGGIRRYELRWRRINPLSSWTTIITPDTFVEIFGLSAGSYEVQINTVDIFERKSKPSPAITQVKGLTARPKNVSNFRLEQSTASDGLAQLSWDPSDELDMQINGIFVIRHDRSNSLQWGSGVEISRVPGNANTATVPLISGTYAIRAVDSTGNISQAPTFVKTDFANIPGFNALVTQVESPNFNGTQENLFEDTVNQTLELNGLGSIDSFEDNIDTIENWDQTLTDDSVQKLGTYLFSSPIDLGGVFEAMCTMNVTSSIFSQSDLIDSQTSLFDSILDEIDELGSIDDGAKVVPQIALSNDGSTYTDWQPFIRGFYTARFFRFRLLFISSVPQANVRVSFLSVTVDAPDKEFNGDITSSASGDVTVSYPSGTFTNTPRLFTTIQNMASGDYVTIASQSNTGFSFSIRNSAGTRIVRVLNFSSRGY